MGYEGSGWWGNFFTLRFALSSLISRALVVETIPTWPGEFKLEVTEATKVLPVTLLTLSRHLFNCSDSAISTCSKSAEGSWL